MQSAEHIEKNKKGEYGYEYFDYLYVIITRNDLLNYVVDNLSFNSQEHTEGCSLSITEKENPISNSKIKKLPFNRKDKKFQQSCKEAFMQSLEEDYPAILKLLKTGKLSEVKLTVNLDDKGDLINKGFNFYTATKFMALTKDFSKKFRRSTLLRQIQPASISEPCTTKFYPVWVWFHLTKPFALPTIRQRLTNLLKPIID
jgi:hypothetical protein